MISILGTVALDTLKTPKGTRSHILGGSAVFSSIAASLFASPYIHAVVGEDFPQEHIQFLTKKNINLKNLEIKKNEKTFHWDGYYTEDMAQAHTNKTDLNVLGTFLPQICEKSRENPFILCSNLDPDIQFYAIDQFKNPKLIVLDTMNFWISHKKIALLNAIKKCHILVVNDMELKLLTETSSIIEGLEKAIRMGPQYIIVKKGEHGAILYNGQDFFCCPGYIVKNVVDPTGAGDSFAGAFCGFLSRSSDIDFEKLKEAMVMGILVSALTVQGFGVEGLKDVNMLQLQESLGHYQASVSLPKNLHNLSCFKEEK